VGTLANGATATLNLTATVKTGTRGKVVVNTVSGVNADQTDYNTANNTASVSFTVASTVVSGKVTDAVTDNALATALITLVDNASRTYTTTTTATGLYTFTSTVTKPIAPGLAQISAAKSDYVTKSAAPVIVANVVNAVNFELDTTDLTVTKTDGATSMIPGGTYTYTITITNQGTITATNVVITDVLPTLLTYVSDTSNITHSVPVASTLVWKPKTGIGPSKVFSFKLRVNLANAMPSPSTALTNQVKTKTSSVEANKNNNQAIDNNTSTGNASPAVTISVTPAQVSTGQNATYTIKVKNNGNAPATDLTLTDTFSTFVDLVSATTNRGTATTNNTSRQVTVTIPLLRAAEEATVTVVVRVNTTARTNTTVSNQASLTYKFDGSTRSAVSNSVSFQLIYSATLPGTGGMEPVQAQARPDLISLGIAVLLGLLGVGLIGYALSARQRRSDWAAWMLRMGLVFSLSAFLFGGVAWGLNSLLAERQARQASAQTASLPSIAAEPTPARAQHDEPPIIMPPNPLASAPDEVLPEYSIPAPVLQGEATPGEPAVDTSPITRIVIPILGLDTVVKYIPFDGMTWIISGLQQEVAWMGETAWPGLGGNTALAGHITLRNGANGPFRYLADLRYGDVVWVYTEQNLYEYLVEEQRVVEETDMSIVSPSDDTLLTLITCTDWNTTLRYYQRRLVVRAALNSVAPVEAETALGR
jgi:LPXTG-site transpeptidase (sortase) family protein